MSTILPKLFADEVPLKENITYEILETFGIFHTIGEKVEKTKFRHRSFAEFLGYAIHLVLRQIFKNVSKRQRKTVNQFGVGGDMTSTNSNS